MIQEFDMYNKIMVPVDLAHVERLDKALKTAADLGQHYSIPVCYVGITPLTPSSIAHNPVEYGEKLADFGRRQAEKYGHEAMTKAYASHDPAVDLNDTLLAAVKEIGADLVVMASHVPGLAENLWPSHGGKVASHSDASVFVVR
jgi:nucleotide-binding universal stress UspA family protein